MNNKSIKTMQIQIIMLVIVATLFQGCGCDIIIKEERPDSINRLTLEVPDKTNQVVAQKGLPTGWSLETCGDRWRTVNNNGYRSCWDFATRQEAVDFAIHCAEAEIVKNNRKWVKVP